VFDPQNNRKERPMKRKLTASLAAISGVVLGFCIQAEAADIAAQPYVKVPPSPPYNWNGFYIGANFGGVFTKERASAGSDFLEAPSIFSSNPSGVLGGLQFGYNLQFAPQWLIGIEGELDWTSAQGTANAFGPAATVTLTSNHNWYDTIDGRLGYMMGPVLIYAKGGAAWMNSDYALTAAGAITGLSSVKATRDGWTAGGGLEAFIMPNWSAKLEYDYLDFGHYNYSFSPVTAFDFKTEVHEIKVGVNYHLLPGAFGF
jgi:opacity protein-like surface antigen